jgi:hypothetical protein
MAFALVNCGAVIISSPKIKKAGPQRASHVRKNKKTELRSG